VKTDIIYNEDCASKEGLRILPNESVDLIIADPPYLTTEESWDRKEVVNSQLSSEFFRVLKPTGSLYVWCGMGEKSQSLIRWFPIFSELFHFKDLITWKKRRGIGMRRGWLYTREEIMWFVKDNKRFVWREEAQYNPSEVNQFTKGFTGYACKSKFKRITNIWTDIPETLTRKGIEHFTPKPVEAIERVIKAHTQEGDVVLDPFMGSGTTAVACVKLNRKYVGFEINKEYCKVANRRIKEARTVQFSKKGEYYEL